MAKRRWGLKKIEGTPKRVHKEQALIVHEPQPGMSEDNSSQMIVQEQTLITGEPQPGTSKDDNSSKINFDVSGRRIVDIQFLLRTILRSGKHKPFDCSIIDMDILSEKKNGLACTYFLQCRMCGITTTLSTEDPSSGNVTVNLALAVAAVSVGIGFSQFEELLAMMDIHYMSHHTYDILQDRIYEKMRDSAWNSMKQAGEEEADLAKQVGEVNREGIPIITVIADGAWCKRSYKVNYDALSGVACIIGQRTGKLLFLGVRNKYCTTCSRVKALNLENVPEHTCFKNWTGPSTGMESDIILEGFKRSLEIHGMIFGRLVGDGDSSVYRKILAAKPYGNMLVEKIECRNHLLRNFCNKVRELSNNKRSISKNCPVPPKLRKLLLEKIIKLRSAIRKATEKRIADDTAFADKLSHLQGDILNSPSHVFGEHKSCHDIGYFCDGTPKEGEINYVPEMQECGLYDDIIHCLQRLIMNSASLLANMDNNSAELYNSILCKFVGGKRLNFAMRNAYESRCYAAALSYNHRWKYPEAVQEAFAKKAVSDIKRKYMLKKQRSLEAVRANRKRNKEQGHYLKRKKSSAPADHDYGPEAHEQQPDMSEEEFAKKREDFLTGLQKTDDEIKELEKGTRGQASNPVWSRERHVRLTASHFGEICRMRTGTSCANKVKNLIYSEFKGNKATKYGMENERKAIEQFQEESKISVVPCGFFVDAENAYLGASPDGLTSDGGLLEIKCPYTAEHFHPKEAIQKKNYKILFFG